jgi:hypothetical protein
LFVIVSAFFLALFGASLEKMGREKKKETEDKEVTGHQQPHKNTLLFSFLVFSSNLDFFFFPFFLYFSTAAYIHTPLQKKKKKHKHTAY